MKKAVGLILTGVLGFAGAANAAILEGTFSGTVYQSFDEKYYDGTTLFGGAVAGGQNGQTITGTIRIDTGLAPADSNADPAYGYYSSTNDANSWLSLSMTLDGVTMVFDSTREQRANVNPYYPGHPYDYFGVYNQDFQSSNSNGVTTYSYDTGSVYIVDYLQNLLDGDSLDQAFSFTDNSAQYGGGAYQYVNYIYDSNTGRYIDGNYAYGFFNLDEMTLSRMSVPEPATIFILGLGLAGLGVTRKLK